MFPCAFQFGPPFVSSPPPRCVPLFHSGPRTLFCTTTSTNFFSFHGTFCFLPPPQHNVLLYSRAPWPRAIFWVYLLVTDRPDVPACPLPLVFGNNRVEFPFPLWPQPTLRYQTPCCWLRNFAFSANFFSWSPSLTVSSDPLTSPHASSSLTLVRIFCSPFPTSTPR